MKYEIKKLHFGDIRKVAQTFNDLDLTSEQVKSLYELFTSLQNQVSFASVEAADAYLRQNTSKEEYEVLKTKNDEEKVSYAVALRLEKSDFVETVISQALFLVNILATKFDVIVDFMNYFIENVDTKQILAFEGSDTKKALLAIFTDGGFLQYFKSMFN